MCAPFFRVAQGIAPAAYHHQFFSVPPFDAAAKKGVGVNTPDV
jgi:hypothetical protein